MSSIKDLLPQTGYEKESILKAFFLFFISINLLLLGMGYLYYKNKVIQLEQEIFLKLKNYSYTFKGEEYRLEIVPKKEKISFYQLERDSSGLFIYVPIPFVEDDVLKITFPAEKYREKINHIQKHIITTLLLTTIIVGIMSFMFALYAVHPIRKSTRLMNEFVRDVVHDINTPVSSLLLNLKIMKMKYGEDEEIKRIESSVKRLSSIYENLSLLDREIKKNEKTVNIKKIILDEIQDLKLSYPDIQVTLNLEDVSIKTDENAIRRIILNLLSNAFKHNVKNGWVDVYLNKNYLKIVNSSRPVKNTDRLFDRYYKESQRGVGLGLSIVKKLASELGLSVQVNYSNNKFTAVLYF